MSRTQSALAVEPRVYPAGRAVALLAAGAPEIAGRRFTIEGRRVAGVRFGRLALALTYVDPLEYSPEAIARKRDDRTWLRTEARIHERAVERAASAGSLVPLRMLSILPHPSALEAFAREQYVRWCRTLTRLEDRREYALQSFVGPHAPPGGESYLLRVSARAVRGGRAGAFRGDPRAREHVAALQEACAAVRAPVRRLARDPRRGQTFGVTLLLRPAEADALRTRVAALAADAAPLGVTHYFEGPRPPFSFS